MSLAISAKVAGKATMSLDLLVPHVSGPSRKLLMPSLILSSKLSYCTMSLSFATLIRVRTLCLFNYFITVCVDTGW